MPAISISKTYADGDILFESDLDTIREDIETFLNVTKIDDDNIQDSGITASSKLVDATVTAAKLAADSVTTTKIADLNVTTAKINDLAVTAAKLGASAVETAKINDSAVTTAKINDGAVTQAKRAALGQQISSTCDIFSTTSTSAVDVTNLSITITTTGRPVFLTLIKNDGVANPSTITVNDTDASAAATLYILRDSTEIYETNLVVAATGATSVQLTVPPGIINHIDIPAAGTYTYKVQAAVSSGDNMGMAHMKLVAFEL